MIQHKKNTLYPLSFPMVSTISPYNFKTGLSPTDDAFYKDGAGEWTTLAITDSATEIGSTGMYEIDLSASEMNHDYVLIKFSGTGAADTAYLFSMTDNTLDEVNTLLLTVDTNVSGVKTVTDLLPDGGALSSIATAANLTTVDTVVDGIKAVTDLLPDAGALSSLATAAALAIIDTVVDSIAVDTAEIGAAGAGLTDLGGMSTTMQAQINTQVDLGITDAALATAANLATVDTNIDYIKTVTDALPDSGALTSLATASALAVVDSNIDAVLVDTGTTLPASISAITPPSAADIVNEWETQSQTDPTGFHVNVKEWNGTAVTVSSTTALPEVDTKSISDNAASADAVQTNISNLDAPISIVDANVDLVLTDTAEIGIAGAGLTDLGGMSTAMKAEVNAEADTAISDAALATAANLAIVDSNVDAILVDTGTDIPASIAALNDLSITDVLTTQMTQEYAADGTAPTVAQALFMIQQMLGEFSISGTTLTVKRIDGATTAATFTLNDATDPTSITRAS